MRMVSHNKIQRMRVVDEKHENTFIDNNAGRIVDDSDSMWK